METFSLALVALFAWYITANALALQCNVCTNIPAEAGISGKPCSDPDFLECPLDINRCMTVEFKMTILGAGSLDFTLKNCSNARICAPDFVANSCKGLNSTVTGLMLSCTADCCQGDNCNGIASGAEVAGLSVWLASFTAILMALYQKFLN